MSEVQVPSPDDFAGPTLAAAASIIREYGERNNLTPRQLVDIFNAGVVQHAQATADAVKGR